MAHNVSGWRRFASPNKGLRSIEPEVRDQGWQNVVEQNPTKGEARLVFCGTRAAVRRRSANRLLYDVPYFTLYFY